MCKILLVQDDPVRQKIMCKNIQRVFGDKIETLIAENGKKGVAEFKEYQEDIAFVIMDYHMPEMNGDESSRKILAISPDTKILAWTDTQESVKISNLIKSGVIGFLPAQCNAGQLKLELGKYGLLNRVAGQSHEKMNAVNSLVFTQHHCQSDQYEPVTFSLSELRKFNFKAV